MIFLLQVPMILNIKCENTINRMWTKLSIKVTSVSNFPGCQNLSNHLIFFRRISSFYQVFSVAYWLGSFCICMLVTILSIAYFGGFYRILSSNTCPQNLLWRVFDSLKVYYLGKKGEYKPQLGDKYSTVNSNV